MSSFERKIKRQQVKEKKKLAEKEMATKTAMFGSLDDKCLICEEKFDKTNKDMVKAWYVVVREKENKVNLYCPSCWESALQQIKDIQKAIAEANSDN